jgi:hypothetical protein
MQCLNQYRTDLVIHTPSLFSREIRGWYSLMTSSARWYVVSPALKCQFQLIIKLFMQEVKSILGTVKKVCLNECLDAYLPDAQLVFY